METGVKVFKRTKILKQYMTFTKEFETKVKKETVKLLSKEDKTLVACSGGKDSTTILYLLHKWGYNVEAIIIDLLMGKWFKQNVENITNFCEEKGINLHVINLRKELGGSMCYLRSCIQTKARLNNCMICGVIKRHLLNKKAKELGATKLVTGHNRDDLAESVIMNLVMGNPKLCMGLGPITGIVRNELFTQRVKPLNYIAEEEIRKYSKEMRFPVIYEPCPCSHNAFRRTIRNLIKEYGINQDNIVKFLRKIDPLINKKYKVKGELKKCNTCGEASRSEQCKACSIISLL